VEACRVPRIEDFMLPGHAGAQRDVTRAVGGIGASVRKPEVLPMVMG